MSNFSLTNDLFKLINIVAEVTMKSKLFCVWYLMDQWPVITWTRNVASRLLLLRRYLVHLALFFWPSQTFNRPPSISPCTQNNYLVKNTDTYTKRDYRECSNGERFILRTSMICSLSSALLVTDFFNLHRAFLIYNLETYTGKHNITYLTNIVIIYVSSDTSLCYSIFSDTSVSS